jgi:hypothetical protein
MNVQTGVRDTNTHEFLGGPRSAGQLAAEHTLKERHEQGKRTS